jgi:hypothetical protein
MIITFLVIIVAQFGFQYFTKKDYEQALDRCYFSIVSIIMYWWAINKLHVGF